MIIAVPLSFAESSSSSSSSVSSSSSSASSVNPCAGLTGENLIICMNSVVRSKAKNQPGGANRMNSLANAILSSCKTQRGTEKAICIRRLTKSGMRADKLVIKNRVEKNDAIETCKGRGKSRALCSQLLIKKIEHTRGKMNYDTGSSSSSSSSSSTSSAQ